MAEDGLNGNYGAKGALCDLPPAQSLQILGKKPQESGDCHAPGFSPSWVRMEQKTSANVAPACSLRSLPFPK